MKRLESDLSQRRGSLSTGVLYSGIQHNLGGFYEKGRVLDMASSVDVFRENGTLYCVSVRDPYSDTCRNARKLDDWW